MQKGLHSSLRVELLDRDFSLPKTQVKGDYIISIPYVSVQTRVPVVQLFGLLAMYVILNMIVDGVGHSCR